VNGFLCQGTDEKFTFEETVQMLEELFADQGLDKWRDSDILCKNILNIKEKTGNTGETGIRNGAGGSELWKQKHLERLKERRESMKSNLRGC